MFKQYAMYHDKYLVRVLNDNSQRGYKIKIRYITTDLKGKMVDSKSTRWVSPDQLVKLTPEVVDIMVSAHAI